VTDEIKRYDVNGFGDLIPFDDGRAVLHSDHLAAISALVREREALKSALKDRIETLELTSKRLSDEGKLEHWNRICEVHYIVDHLLPRSGSNA
jgi:hypothetical protein